MAPAPDTFHDPEPQPYLPVLAPSPLVNSSIPEFSGVCELNFLALESIIEKTATNCWGSFGTYLANALCCPQLDATITILVGQWSENSGELMLNETHSRHCLSGLERILESQGAYDKLDELCSTSSNVINATACPVTHVSEFEDIVDSHTLLTSCGNIDLETECCKRTCQNAILNASMEISSHGLPNLGGTPNLTAVSASCENVVLGWLTSKLEPSSANSLLRGISSCQMNNVCPLELPDASNITLDCNTVMRNQPACCNAMNRYMSKLQNQSFITTSQAVNCAASLGLKLQKVNVTGNVFDLCSVGLKDFSLQDSGCLLPSLPSDATYDQATGIGFVCDQIVNTTAPWPSGTYSPSFSCVEGAIAQLPPSDHMSASTLPAGQLRLSLICLMLIVIHLLPKCSSEKQLYFQFQAEAWVNFGSAFTRKTISFFVQA